MDETLACPFCNATPYLEQWFCNRSNHLYARVKCQRCEASGPQCCINAEGQYSTQTSQHAKKAIQSWNKRGEDK